MVQNIPGNFTITTISNNRAEKVKQEHLTNLAKDLKKVSNSYKEIKSHRGITGKFEVNHSNAGKLNSLSGQLDEVKQQAKNGFHKIKSAQYKQSYNENKAKLAKLKNLYLKANNLKTKIDEKITEYKKIQQQSADAWKKHNDPEHIKQAWEAREQRRDDARKDISPGGMIK